MTTFHWHACFTNSALMHRDSLSLRNSHINPFQDYCCELNVLVVFSNSVSCPLFGMVRIRLTPSCAVLSPVPVEPQSHRALEIASTWSRARYFLAEIVVDLLRRINALLS